MTRSSIFPLNDRWVCSCRGREGSGNMLIGSVFWLTTIRKLVTELHSLSSGLLVRLHRRQVLGSWSISLSGKCEMFCTIPMGKRAEIMNKYIMWLIVLFLKCQMRDSLKRNITWRKMNKWKKLFLAFNVIKACQKALVNYDIIFQGKRCKFYQLKWGSECNTRISSCSHLFFFCYPVIIQKQVPREFQILCDTIWGLAVFQIQSVEVSLVSLWVYQERNREK